MKTNHTRRRFCSVFIFGCVAIFVVAVSPLTRFPRVQVSTAAFERLSEGMSRGEVEEVLGGPAADYTEKDTLDTSIFSIQGIGKDDTDWLFTYETGSAAGNVVGR